jgi:putative FmdB family regulatory protein
VGLEHKVELARLRQLAAALGAAQLGLGVAPLGGDRLAQVVLAPAPLALAEALDERIGEALEVTRGLPDPRVLEDRRVDRDDVVAILQHRPPPLGLDVVLEQHAVVPVVVGRAEAAVDLRGGKDEAAPLAERDDLLHRDLGRARVRLGGCHVRTVSAAIIPQPVPIYEYKCANGHVFDVIQKMSDEALTACQECGASAERVLHPVAVHFKGSGFYNTDYGKKKGGGNGAGEGAKESQGSDGGSSSGSGSSDSKSSESKSDSKAAASTAD